MVFPSVIITISAENINLMNTQLDAVITKTMAYLMQVAYIW